MKMAEKMILKPVSNETLVAKITATIGNMTADQGRLKDVLWKRMQSAVDAGLRDELIVTLRSARFLVRRNHQLDEVILPKWQEALAASAALVRAENAAGHKGQQLFDAVLRDDFVAMEERVQDFVISRERGDDLVTDLEDLVFQTTNFVWDGGWCRCGAPIPTSWKWCRGCYKPRHSAEVSDAPVKPRVKKPGSAARRHTDGPQAGRKPFEKGKKNK